MFICPITGADCLTCENNGTCKLATEHQQKFRRKHDASPFDGSDPRDARSEIARKILVRAFNDALETCDAKTSEDFHDIAGGLLVGLVCITAAHMENTDENHAALRAGLIQLIPWAVDLVRSMSDLPPLPEA